MSIMSSHGPAKCRKPGNSVRRLPKLPLFQQKCLDMSAQSSFQFAAIGDLVAFENHRTMDHECDQSIDHFR